MECWQLAGSWQLGMAWSGRIDGGGDGGLMFDVGRFNRGSVLVETYLSRPSNDAMTIRHFFPLVLFFQVIVSLLGVVKEVTH